MADWTKDATEYLEGYLKQVAALARNQGDDANEIVSGLHDHIVHEVENVAEDSVDIDTLFGVLATIGTPEEVTSMEGSPLDTVNSNRPKKSRTRSDSGPRWYRSWPGYAVGGCAFLFLGMVALSILSIIATMFLAAKPMADNIIASEMVEDTVATEKKLAACKDNLMALDNSLRDYAREHDQFFPPLSEQRGRLMFAPDALNPETLNYFKVFFCPTSKFNGAMKLKDNAVDDHSYYYLSHELWDEDDGLAYVREYRVAAEMGKGFEVDFTYTEGSTIPRILSGLTVETRHPDADIIPVMIEKPGHHDSPGGHVLFLDGHVEYINLGEKFPMTQSFIHALESIDD